MTTPPSELDTRTRLDIADVLVRYATGIDRRDWTLFRSCFTDDCVADYGDIGVWHGADEITEWMDRAVGFYDDDLVRTTFRFVRGRGRNEPRGLVKVRGTVDGQPFECSFMARWRGRAGQVAVRDSAIGPKGSRHTDVTISAKSPIAISHARR